MRLELVAANGPIDDFYADLQADDRAATGIVIGVLCGALFWFALGMGIAAGPVDLELNCRQSRHPKF